MIDAVAQRHLFELDLAYGECALRTRALPPRETFAQLARKRGLPADAAERWLTGKAWS